MYPCGEVYMAYVSSGIPLIWGVKVLHIIVYHAVRLQQLEHFVFGNENKIVQNWLL